MSTNIITETRVILIELESEQRLIRQADETSLIAFEDDSVSLLNSQETSLLMSDDVPEVRTIVTTEHILLELGSDRQGTQGLPGVGVQSFNVVVPALSTTVVFTSATVGRSIRAQVSNFDSTANLHRSFMFNGGLLSSGMVDDNITDVVGDINLNTLATATHAAGIFSLSIINTSANSLESNGIVSII